MAGVAEQSLRCVEGNIISVDILCMVMAVVIVAVLSMAVAWQ